MTYHKLINFMLSCDTSEHERMNMKPKNSRIINTLHKFFLLLLPRTWKEDDMDINDNNGTYTW